LGTDEASWLRQARAGDRGAFERIYRAHAGRVYTLVTRICGSRDIGQDLTQEAFVLVWRKLAGFRGDSSLGTWIHRIAANVALGHLRRHKAWGHPDELEESMAGLPVHPGPDTVAIDLERAIATLPPRARSVLVLHDLEGFEHHEISALMGIAEGTCKAQLHRARKLLIGRMG
jgi:RNA polymerase sigma factor (sigma-70 family)